MPPASLSVGVDPNSKLSAAEAIAALPEVNNETDQDALETQQERNEFFEWDEAKKFLTALKDQFNAESDATLGNRERRNIDVNIKQMQDEKRLKKCDTFIPMRVVDEGIRREKPTYVAYLQQSRRVAILADVYYPKDKHDELELSYTRGMQYKDWLTSHTQVVDGGQLHGWDWSETLFDDTKPLLASIEHVGHDRLIFPLSCEDIQNCSRVMRLFKWTKLQLKTFVKRNAFDKEQVRKLLQGNDQKDTKDGSQKDVVYDIYKVYFKFDGCVYVAWASLVSCDNWLKKPEKFYNGVDHKVTVQTPQEPIVDPVTGALVQQPPLVETKWEPVEETEYPLNLFAYQQTEDKPVANTKGRAFIDKFKQEAMTVGWTGFLNAHNRAAMLMGSKAEDDGKPASQLQNLELGDGKIYPFKIDWFKMPFPDPSMLQGLQLFDAKIASGNGQMTYAVQNKSSGARTTKAEVNSAERDTTLFASVNVSMFASYVRSCYERAWRIVQSQALQDNIPLYGEVIPAPPNPVTGEVEAEPDFVNFKDIIGRKFDVRPAGDVDYVQRTEMIEDMMQFWAVVQNTPIAPDFLAYLLKIKFGELGDQWAQKLLAGDMKTQLLAQCLQILQGLLMNPAEALQMTPEDQQNLQMLIMEITTALTPTPQPSPTNANAGATGTPKPKQPTNSDGTSKDTGGQPAGASGMVSKSTNPGGLQKPNGGQGPAQK